MATSTQRTRTTMVMAMVVVVTMAMVTTMLMKLSSSVVERRRAEQRHGQRTESNLTAFLRSMNNSLTALQRQQFRRYGRQLYRMLLRVSADPHTLPTVEARTFLRLHTREQFRRHSPLVQTQADAQALLERAHTVLLAIADEASKRPPPSRTE